MCVWRTCFVVKHVTSFIPLVAMVTSGYHRDSGRSQSIRRRSLVGHVALISSHRCRFHPLCIVVPSIIHTKGRVSCLLGESDNSVFKTLGRWFCVCGEMYTCQVQCVCRHHGDALALTTLASALPARHVTCWNLQSFEGRTHCPL